MLTIGEYLANSAKKYAQKPCVVVADRCWTYVEFDRWVNQLCHGLLASGVQQGDRVALLSTDGPECLALIFAAARIGAMFVPLNFRLRAPELQALLHHCEPKIIFFEQRYLSVIEALELPAGSEAICLTESGAGHRASVDVSTGQPTTPPVLATPIDPEDIASILYTSGTTGTPKGVMLSHRAWFHRSVNFLIEWSLSPQDICYSASPLFHVAGGGLVLPFIHRGATVFLMPQFHLESFLAAVTEHHISFAFLVPTMIRQMMSSPERKRFDLSSLRMIYYGGSPIPINTLRQALAELKCDFVQSYGQTEDTAQANMSGADHRAFAAYSDDRLRACGQPTINVDVRVVDEADLDVPRRTVGEIISRSGQMMSGYWRNEEATRETLRGGWLHTGDLGYMDEQGYLYVVDRKKDLIIRGGENVYPAEVEHVLHLHPHVREAAVIGVPSEERGEEVKAVIVLQPGVPATAETAAGITSFCRARLASFKKPTFIDFTDALPRTPSGKVMKPALREKYAYGRRH